MGSPQFPKVRTGGDASRTQDNIAGQLAPVATAVAATPIMGAPPPAWVPFNIQAGWSNHNAECVPAYHKDALGYVHVKGAWHNSSGGPSSAVCGIFPLGYRPREVNVFAIAVSGGNSQGVIINPDGTMQPDANIPNNGHMHTSFSFLAEQ